MVESNSCIKEAAKFPQHLSLFELLGKVWLRYSNSFSKFLAFLKAQAC